MTTTEEEITARIGEVMDAIATDLRVAVIADAPYCSAHEAYAYLRHAQDQLWSAVASYRPEPRQAARVAGELSVLACRFLLDIGGEPADTTSVVGRTDRILAMVKAELSSATLKFGAMASAMEGWAVIQEELDELWDAVRNDKRPDAVQLQRGEALQVAAMGARVLLDIGR